MGERLGLAVALVVGCRGDVPYRGGQSSSRSVREKAMATHSSTLAWKIPLVEEPGRLHSMGSIGFGHD